MAQGDFGGRGLFLLAVLLVAAPCVGAQTPYPVPGVAGKTQTDAVTSITTANDGAIPPLSYNFSVGATVEHYSSTIAAGLAINTIPQMGTMIAAGSSVTLVMSKGPHPYFTGVDIPWANYQELAADMQAQLDALMNKYTQCNLWTADCNSQTAINSQIVGQNGPSWIGSDNGATGVVGTPGWVYAPTGMPDSKRFALLEAVVSPSSCLNGILPESIRTVRAAFAANRDKPMQELHAENVTLKATLVYGINYSVDSTFAITTGQFNTVTGLPVVGSATFSMPSMESLVDDTSQPLNSALRNLCAAYMTMGDSRGAQYWYSFMGRMGFAFLKDLLPKMASAFGAKSDSGEMHIATNSPGEALGAAVMIALSRVELERGAKVLGDGTCAPWGDAAPLHVGPLSRIAFSGGYVDNATVDIPAADVCAAITNWASNYQIGPERYQGLAALLGSGGSGDNMGDLNGDGKTNLDSYIVSGGDLAKFLLAEGILSTAPCTIAVEATDVTPNGFTANWTYNAGKPTGGLLDVSASSVFEVRIPGYDGLDTGTNVSLPVTGLSPDMTYYYRLRDDQGLPSNTIIVHTLPALPTHTLTIIEPANGTIIANPPMPAGGYEAGTPVSLTAVAFETYVFGAWTGANGAEIQPGNLPQGTIIMNGDKVVGADFLPIFTTRTLTIIEPANGTITANPPMPVGGYAPDTPVSLTATASANYVFGAWTGANGTEIQPANLSQATIIMNGDKTVGADFLPIFTTIPHSPLTTACPNGTGALLIPYGAPATFTEAGSMPIFALTPNYDNPVTSWPTSGNWDFCAAFDTASCSLRSFSEVSQEMGAYASMFLCTADLNGPLNFDPQAPLPLSANGIPDGEFELGLLAAVLNNTHTLNPARTGGVANDQVLTAFKANFNYFKVLVTQALATSTGQDLRGAIPELCPWLPASMVSCLAGYALEGDSDTVAALNVIVLAALGISPPAEGVQSVTTGFPTLLGPDGDADGDGYTNRQEYELFKSQGAAAAIAAQMNPDIPTPTLTTFMLSITQPSGGSVTASPGMPAGGYSDGTVVALTATPDEAYVFSAWTGSNGAEVQPTGLGKGTIVMDGDKAVSAEFQSVGPCVVQGTVTNSITQNPVGGAYVEVDEAVGKAIASGRTGADGRYSITLPACRDAAKFTFSCREYQTETLWWVSNPSTNPVDAMLEPVEVSAPKRPIVYSGPHAVFIEWDANPEYSLKGYYVWRVATDAAGVPTGVLEKVSGLLTETEYQDTTTVPGVLYRYQVQALSGADRPSALSPEPEAPVKAQYLTVFMPDIAVDSALANLYLWDFTPEGAQKKQWVRLPICTRSAYEVSSSAMDLVVDLPTALLDAAPGADIRVESTGITFGMGTASSVSTAGELRITAGDPFGARSLYGSGVLFNVYIPKKDTADCGPLSLVPDESSGGGRPGLRIHDDGTPPVPVPLLLESGTLCTRSARLHGDVNGDGVIDYPDVVRIREIYVGRVQADSDSAKAGDLNMDKRVDSADAIQLQRWLAKIRINPPAGYSASALRPEVLIGRAVGLPNSSITVPVTIRNASRLAGFTMTVNFLSGPEGLAFERAALGGGVPDLYGISSMDNTKGEYGSLLLAVSGAEPLGTDAETELARLTFTVGAAVRGGDELPLILAAFDGSDAYAFTPRHNAPGRPAIVKAPPAPVLVTVPDLVGQSRVSANASLSGAGLAIGAVTEQCGTTMAAGLILSQTPAARQQAPSGSAVAVVVATGPCPAEGEGEGEGESFVPTEADLRARLSDDFDTIDTDGDSSVSYAEALAALPGLTPTVFGVVDANSDGEISRAEAGLSGGCGCAGCAGCTGCSGGKGAWTPGAMREFFSSVFLGGLSLTALLAFGRRRN